MVALRAGDGAWVAEPFDETRGDIATRQGMAMTYDRSPRAATPATPTTLSSIAHGSQTRSKPRSRTSLLWNAAAVVAGGALGTVLALRTPASSTPALSGDAQVGLPAPPPGAASASGSAPAMAVAGEPSAGSAAAAPPAPADRHAAVVAQIKEALQHFVSWSRAHAGARCPDAAALGVAVLDPWGQPLRIVCADQPADQIAGVLSFGPDGVPGTGDDVLSWTLGSGVTDLVRGPRWGSTRHATMRPGAATRPTDPSMRPPGNAGAGSNDTDGEGIPNRR
jgi:hypothetical protein